MCPISIDSDFEGFLDELFGESWPCGEEVVFYCGYHCGCAWAPQRDIEKTAHIGF